MRIAHFSDLHLLAMDGVRMSRFLNKRITGLANLRLKRGSIHRASYARAVAREIARLDVDHVVVTGDLTNLSLESEFEIARQVIEKDLRMDPSRVTIVPGNHDRYTRGSLRSMRFEHYFAPWLESDRNTRGRNADAGDFPVVKLRGAVAFVGLSSAVPRPPLVAAGELGAAQLTLLADVLAQPEVARRALVLALHHPPLPRRGASRLKVYLEGLRDAQALLAQLRTISRGLILHGHLHRRVQRAVPTKEGVVTQIGATSASLHHDAPDRMAGFNMYEIDDAGNLESVLAHVYSPLTGEFHLESVPKLL